MNLSLTILEIYPGLVAGRDFEVRDDGSGPYISRWDNPNPRPTNAELASAWLRVVKRLKKGDFASRAVGEMEALYPEVANEPRKAIWIAVVSALSNSQDPRMASVRNVRDKLNRGQSAVDTKATITEVEAMKWENA